MKLSRTACYAIHAAASIAREGNVRPIVGNIVAKELGLSQGFLLRILVALARAGLLRSFKGPNGGYSLARTTEMLTLLEIVEAAEGPIVGRADPTSSPPDALDSKVEKAATEAAERVRKELGRVTLADLVGGRKKGR